MRPVAAARKAWGGASRGARIAVVLVAVVVGLNLVTFGIDAVGGGNPYGPVSSSYTTGPVGTAALAELLGQAGHSVERHRDSPREAPVDVGATAIVLDPGLVDERDADALGRFVSGGGRLVVGGAPPSALLELVAPPPVHSSTGTELSRPLLPVPETQGVGEVRSAGGGAWASAGAALPVLGDTSSDVMLVATVGAGRIVLLADSSPLQNRLLGAGNNAALAVALAGEPERPVVFLESFHGYRDAGGLGAIPYRWRWALAGMTLAALVWMWARARRLGPPEPVARALAPARRAFVDAMAVNLARSRSPHEAIEPVRAEIRRRVAAASGLGPDATPEELAEAAARMSLGTRESAAAFGEVKSDAEVMAAGRALARVTGGHGWE